MHRTFQSFSAFIIPDVRGSTNICPFDHSQSTSAGQVFPFRKRKRRTCYCYNIGNKSKTRRISGRMIDCAVKNTDTQSLKSAPREKS